jgi:hypothetical protein
MIFTDRILQKDLTDWQLGNRETLHTICLPDNDGLRKNNYELRMLWGIPIVYCGKTSNKIFGTLPTVRSDFKTLKAFTEEDTGENVI